MLPVKETKKIDNVHQEHEQGGAQLIIYLLLWITQSSCMKEIWTRYIQQFQLL